MTYTGQAIWIETRRLVVRDHVAEDLDPFTALMTDRETMTYLRDTRCANKEEARKNLELAMCEIGHADRRHFYLAVEETDSGRFVGASGFHIESEKVQDGRAELGYFFLRDFWGRGYATEAAKAVLEFAFNKLGLHKIVTGCYVENAGSERVMIKCGMRREALKRKHSLHRGEWKDRAEYGLLREEWLEQAGLEEAQA